jgi:hypothetical protein
MGHLLIEKASFISVPVALECCKNVREIFWWTGGDLNP